MKDPNAELRAEVLASLTERVALAHYQSFEARSSTMASATMALCADPSDTTLQAARDAWWAAREPWKRTEVIKFGPVVEYPERLGPKLDDWPVNAAAVEELVAGDAAVDVDAFESMGSATRGLPVVEYLLWSHGDQTSAALRETPRRCEVLAGASGDVSANATRLQLAWQNDWMGRVGAPDTASADDYDTDQDVIDEWVNRMVFTVENVRATKLGKPVGDGSGGEPQPDVIESRSSGRSLTDARDALAGARDVWTGDVGGEHPGIDALAAADPTLVALINDRFDTAHGRLDEIPETLEETIGIQPEIVARAQEALQALQVVLQVDLAQALSVTVTFNDNDGD